MILENPDLAWKFGVYPRARSAPIGPLADRNSLRDTKALPRFGKGRVLRVDSQHDTLSARAGVFMEALRCPKTLMHFTAAEGAYGHCSMPNRSLLNQRVLDWLDEQFGCSP